jgi:hypothetical protein
MLVRRIRDRLARPFRSEDWSRWYTREWAPAERVFRELSAQLPAYINSVIDLGCAAGRNFGPFVGRYALYGVDLVPREQIEFDFPGVHYIQSPLNKFEPDFRLDNFLCITHGAIMYVKPIDQKALLERFVALGCRNFILQEYDESTLRRDGYCRPNDWLMRLIKDRRNVGYPFSNPMNFEKRWYRPEMPAWVQLA